MIRSKRGLITLGVAIFLVGMVVLFPARVAVAWFVPDNVLLSGVHGTVWRGTASELSVGGLYLRNASWNANPLKLLAGKLSYDVAANPVVGFLESEVQVSLGGLIILQQLRAALPLQVFAGLAGVNGLEGNSSLNFERVVLDNGLAKEADGTVQIANLVIPELSRTSLGGYEAVFSTQNDAVVASVEDTDGAVDLAGSLHVSNDRSYRFVSQVMSKSSTPANIRQLLELLPANDRGQHELRLEGAL